MGSAPSGDGAVPPIEEPVPEPELRHQLAQFWHPHRCEPVRCCPSCASKVFQGLPHTLASERTAARTRLFGILSSVVKERSPPQSGRQREHGLGQRFRWLLPSASWGRSGRGENLGVLAGEVNSCARDARHSVGSHARPPGQEARTRWYELLPRRSSTNLSCTWSSSPIVSRSRWASDTWLT